MNTKQSLLEFRPIREPQDRVVHETIFAYVDVRILVVLFLPLFKIQINFNRL